MIERELKLNTQINTYSLGGLVFTDLRELEAYMTANNVTTAIGDITDTSVTSTDFESDAQAMREEFFTGVDDTITVDDGIIIGVVDDNEDTTDGDATGFI